MENQKHCIYCGTKIKSPRKRFCSNKHKDKYHNETNPRGKFAHLHPDNQDYNEHPFSDEGLGQWID